MRTILYLAILCFLSCGTDQGETKTYTYTVRNESGVLIKIVAYNMHRTTPNEIIHSTTLENGNEVKKIFKDGLPPQGYDFQVFFANLKGSKGLTDSIKVIYNNTKFKIFVSEINCNGGLRNPLNICIYSNTEENFTFTVEDYENAEDCNGNCE